MRRAIHVLFAGGALLAASACGTAPGSGTTTAASAPAAAGTTSAVGAACEALAQAYDKNMAPYAQALTAVATDPRAVPRAQQALAAFAAAVQDATGASPDTELRAAGKKAAEQMQNRSVDAKFFGTIKTTEDVSEAMGPTLTEWLAPVQQHCD